MWINKKKIKIVDKLFDAQFNATESRTPMSSKHLNPIRARYEARVWVVCLLPEMRRIRLQNMIPPKTSPSLSEFQAFYSAS